MPTPKIFVQLAAYRDPELVPTITDLLAKADNPDLFSFGICWQYGPDEDPNVYDGDDRFNVEKIPFEQSQGLGWARNRTNLLWRGEELTLQLDSHHRFEKGWDTMMMEDFAQACGLSPKPILSTYCTPFDTKKPPDNFTPCLMSQYEFSNDKLLMSMPWYIQNFKERSMVIRARTISGHFYLVKSDFIKEVPYDPDIYFGGYTEETTLSVRAFTNGYDVYSPYRQYIWHEYTRIGRPKHWEDHGTSKSTGKTSGERDAFARKKTRQIFGQEDNGIDMTGYDLGTERTLHDYEVFGGFDFKNCRIQDYTLKVNTPPNPPDYENQFITRGYVIESEWDPQHFLKEQEGAELRFLTFGIETSSGVNIYRHDFVPDKHPEESNFRTIKHTAKFRSIDKPHKIVMYANWKERGWGTRFEKVLDSRQIKTTA